MTDTEALKSTPTGWFNLPGDHPLGTHLRNRKFVKGYRHWGMNRWSMILNQEGQLLKKALSPHDRN